MKEEEGERGHGTGGRPPPLSLAEFCPNVRKPTLKVSTAYPSRPHPLESSSTSSLTTAFGKSNDFSPGTDSWPRPKYTQIGLWLRHLRSSGSLFHGQCPEPFTRDSTKGAGKILKRCASGVATCIKPQARGDRSRARPFMRKSPAASTGR